MRRVVHPHARAKSPCSREWRALLRLLMSTLKGASDRGATHSFAQALPRYLPARYVKFTVEVMLRVLVLGGPGGHRYLRQSHRATCSLGPVLSVLS
jgi:hypothetical protein